jgi:hypothetical protein
VVGDRVSDAFLGVAVDDGSQEAYSQVQD